MPRRLWILLCLCVLLSLIGASFSSRRTVVITPRDTEPTQTESTAGESADSLADALQPIDAAASDTAAPEPESLQYVLNTNTKRFHRPDCASVGQMKEKNRSDYSGTREEAIEMGYIPCGRCHP